MSYPTGPTSEDAVQDLLSVADLLEHARLAQLYAHLYQTNTATVTNLIDALDLAQGTAYNYVNRLVDAGVIEPVTDTQPKTYTARELALTVTISDDDTAYTITPALIDAVGRRLTDDDIDTYIDRHGIAGLATAFEYTLARERGHTTHRQMADDLEISAVAAELILQALTPVVNDHYEIDTAGRSADAVENPQPSQPTKNRDREHSR
jgi:DNA-binding MarR family transcriptional regulator